MIPHLSERALILAPHGRDAEIAATMLKEAGCRSHVCRSVPELVDELVAGAGFGLLTEEALETANLLPLSDWIAGQPEWSDFPFVLLTRHGGGLERNPAATRHLQTLGNVTFLERPFHPTTLISLAQAALRGRRRQYEARSRLEELKTLAASLEQRVEERTAEREAAIKQLHEAQKLETIGQLTGGVAHDFNNLLTPIIGALDLLRRKLPEGEPRLARLVDNALQSGERARTLVQRLLGFARRQELQTQATDIAGLLEGMRDLVASSIGPTIELRLHCEAGLPAALVDPNQLELAILNLCVNARDAMPGGGQISLVVEEAAIGPGETPKLAPGLYIRLSVIDTGAGMDPPTLARAIEPFFSTKELGRGTGLGLSMVHGFVAQLGGGFLLSSVVGEGTRADLYLPIAAEAKSQPRNTSLGQDVPGGPPLALLLVDDEDLVRQGTAEMMRHLGHSVTEARGGAEALALLANGCSFDAVVTDYKMPQMDGAELAEKVGRLRPGIPILIVTGYTGHTGELALPRLSKPFGLSELAAALLALMSPAHNVVALRRP